MIKIMEASAGSGKTYNLAKTYIRILLESDDPYKYRHILAVTFTNKATDEMKRRILKELYTLSTDPEGSPYLDDFLKIIPSADRIRDKAHGCLCRILHDYGAFAVSTIDRFFQQTLRAFSREIGQFASYQVELDKNSLVSETVDRILDGLSENDKGLLKWLTDSAMEALDTEGTFHLESEIGRVARGLKSDRLRVPLEESGQKASEMFSRERLRELGEVCSKVIGGFKTTFPQQVKDAAQKVVEVLASHGLTPADFKGRTLVDIARYASGEKSLEKPSEAFMRDAPDSGAWFAKKNQHLLPLVETELGKALDDFCDLFGIPYRTYNTAKILKDQISGLGIAREMEEQFEALLKEKNVLSLDDSNTILKDIIDGSDTPFVYEKLGVRFENFLLDEFQDTSTVQWGNFKPLLGNSQASGFENLVVGDVKQSIYRFRGSDWHLLAHDLPEAFPDYVPDPLQGNYRTLGAIVDFNNQFFAFAAEQLGQEDLYKGVKQKICVKDLAPGSVEVVFKKNYEEELDEIVSTVRDLDEKGWRYSDVAVLVRNNAEGAAVAARLIGEGIPVVSDDSLRIKSSPLVRLAVSALSLVDTPPTVRKDGRLKVPVEAYEAWAAGITVPASYDTLPGLAEDLIRAALQCPGYSLEGEVPYIQSFMDYLQDWVRINGNDLPGFLAQWRDNDPKVSSPASGNSVRIMTIHKSKGLEFPFVIFPFVEKIPFFKSSGADDEGYWCRPRVAGTPLEGKVDGLFNVKFNKNTGDTFFADDLKKEKQLQIVDNLNVLYVAMTRPQYGLKVIAKDGKADAENMGALLKAYTGGSTSYGTLYDASALPEAKCSDQVPLSYHSWPLGDVTGEGSRLKVSADAADFFGADGKVGAEASQRILGNVYHAILSSVRVPSDLEAAVEAAVRRGDIPRPSREAVLAFLKGKIDSVREKNWFPDDPEAILNEVEIVSADGFVHRPDRVVVQDGAATVIDYKFGVEKKGYAAQVRRYMKLLSALGYAPVSGFLWYVEQDEVQQIK